MIYDKKTKENLNIRLKLGIIANFIFTIVEFIIGFWSGSLALISDACHNLTDVCSLAISFFAHKIAQKQPTSKMTYGYGRATILAALINGFILLILSIFIFKESYSRFYRPEPIEGDIVMIVGFFGILVNFGIAILFLKFKDDLNIKSALLNMFFDAVASAAAFFTGIIIILTGKTFIDPIVSILIGLMLLFSALKIIKDVIHLLLEGVPQNIKIEEVIKEIRSIPFIISIDDLHIWTISSGNYSLSCHIIIDQKNLDKSVDIIKDVKKKLKEKFHILHSTIEINLAECKGSLCTLINDIE